MIIYGYFIIIEMLRIVKDSSKEAISHGTLKTHLVFFWFFGIRKNDESSATCIFIFWVMFWPII